MKVREKSNKFETVYKGRKKKTIEYFVIKSVNKLQKNKVLQEVRVLHSLDHANVLKFCSCLQPVRDTREKQVQLWKDLILDYCRTQKIFVIGLEEDFLLFSNPVIEKSKNKDQQTMVIISGSVVFGVLLLVSISWLLIWKSTFHRSNGAAWLWQTTLQMKI